MAVNNKISDTRIKSKKAKKSQGEPAKTGEASDRRVSVVPDSSKDRGIGSSFAMALGNVLEEAKDMKKGSQSGFLGQEKEAIDVKEYSQSLIKQ